ncbi:MAG TPA: GWxTD domain-containing protein, partial [Chryseosolibacter sp.]|nr:GWxTD domain-containing protein [Chryseosolibacter sp.]
PKILAAKIVDQAQKRAWYFFTVLEENYPVNNQLVSQGQPLVKSFVHPSASLEFAEKNNRWVVSYYNDNFPAAAPAFSEGQARVAKTMKPDSVYMLNGSDRFAMQKKGLYLFQTDTMKVAGFSMRVESDYPKFTKFQNLPGPLIYICTKQEYDRLELSADKKAFDRTVLSITADTERAKKLMRSYFRRVEFANEYFTSYKEGWKTDRGMIYIIFGVPDEVYRFNDREVWHYQDGKLEQTFDFVKSPTLFDPDNYVLIRNKKFREQWYEIIDLWRNARF